jgi:Rad3-related DNA helicase
MSIEPVDLNLPVKFKEFRQNQLQVAMKAAGSQKYAFLLDSPTGTGKSIIAATVQRILAKNIIYLCTTKQLQDQLVNDFPYARVLKGRSNYPCNKYFSMWPEITAEMCNDEKDECGYKDSCAYKKAKRAALNAPIAILNMAYFLTEINYGKTFSGAEYVVIDEFDATEDQLMGFIECNISKYTLDMLKLEQPKYKTKFDSWVEWADETINVIKPQIEEMEKEMESAWYQPDPKQARKLINLKRFESKLSFFVRNVSEKWVFYPSESNWSFKPIWISSYADNALWKHMKKVLGMSATILEPRQAAKNIGLEDFEYLALPSPFPKENRPVEFIPCGNIIEKELNIALPMLARKVDELIRLHPNDKILCHTVSYKIRDYLVEHIKTDRFITHQTKDKGEKLDAFKRSDKPLVMLSPSMDRGVDLPYDQCRVVIICKIPYPNLGDPQISKRLYGSKDGRFWYAYTTIKTIVQMAGRGVRAADDYAKTYILDGQFERIYKEHLNMFPQWFKEAVIM